MSSKKVVVHKPDPYERKLNQIEDFYFQSSGSLEPVRWFLNEHQDAIDFISKNPRTPQKLHQTGDYSWPFANGNCRLFYSLVETATQIDLYLSDLIDNRMENAKYYPQNVIYTFPITDE